LEYPGNDDKGRKPVAEGLYLPIRFAGNKDGQPRSGPEFIVPITYSEVTGRRPDAADLWKALTAGNPANTVVTLATIINAIERFSRDATLQQALSDTFLRPEYRKKPEASPGERLPDYRYVFNALGLLFALKVLLGASPATQVTTAEIDPFSIGDLVLICNEFAISSTLSATNLTDSSVAADLLPSWDLANRGRLVYALARIHRMVEVHLAGPDLKVGRLLKHIGLDVKSVHFYGVSLKDYVFAVFALYAREQQLNGPALLSNPELAIFDPGTLLEQTNFPELVFQRFLDSASVSPDSIRRKLSGTDGGWDECALSELLGSSIFASDFLALREHPILHLDGSRYLVLDPDFLGELLSSGIIFQIRGAVPEGKGAQLMSLFGRLFELYLIELLAHFYPWGSGILQVDVHFPGGQVDALLDFGTYVVLLEFKFFLLKHEIKHGRKSGELEKSLREKLVENERGERKAARQLAQAAQALHDRSIKTASLRNKPIYPVVVVYESGLQCPGANAFINRIFQEYRAQITDSTLVRPLTVMSVEELEGLLPQTEAALTTWQEVLEERFSRDEVQLISIHQAIYDILKRKGKRAKNNEFLHDTSDGIFESITAYFPEQSRKASTETSDTEAPGSS
jgi:hypothetical protein